VLKTLISLVLIVLMVKIGLSLPQQTQSTQIQIEKQNKPQTIPGKSTDEEQTKKKKFPWIGTLVVTALAVTAGILLSACKSVDGPEPPEPEKTYTLEVTYYRVDVKNLDELGFGPLIFIGWDGGPTIDYLNGDLKTRIDDYTFQGIFPKQRSAGIYCINARDSAREETKNDGTIIVGYKFKIRVKETGSEIVLARVLKNTMRDLVEATEKSTMGRFQLTKEGDVFEY